MTCSIDAKSKINQSHHTLSCVRESKLRYEDLSWMSKAGAGFENAMTAAFTWWGTRAALYPLPVIVLSIGFAAGLSSGQNYFNVVVFLTIFTTFGSMQTTVYYKFWV